MKRAPPAAVYLVVAALGAIAIAVGRDGSVAWRLARVAVVAASGAVAVGAARRLDDRRRGWLLVGVGTIALAVGVGFAPWIAKETASLPALASLVAIVAGLALIATGTVARTRRHRRLRRAAAVIGTLLVVALTMFVVVPAVAATNVPPTRTGATPESVELAYENVTLITGDGVRLAGWYVASSNGAAVVLRHGSGSTRSSMLRQASVLARYGFGVLLVDARGHGDSGGRAMDFGWHGDADIAAATDYLTGRADVDPGRIAVVGSSMGGEEAIGASGSNDVIRAVVAEGATARSAADKGWLSDAYGVRGLVQEQIERVQYWLTDRLTSARTPVSLRTAVARSDDVPYLLITAGKVADESDAAAYVASAAPDRVQIWNVDGAGHTDALSVAPGEWETRVVTFLEASLDLPTSDRRREEP
jgi:pimeloyl-ACP methyl ester carboxylesterase